MSTQTSLQQTVAARVRAVMAARQLDLADISEPLGLSNDALSRRLNGRVGFSIRDIEGISQLLGYEPAEFFADSFEIIPMRRAA